MDDLKFGARNKRGDFTPSARLEVVPLWAWPPHIPKVLAWIPAYLWPWNAFHLATALAYWRFVVPDVDGCFGGSHDISTFLFGYLGLALGPGPWYPRRRKR